MKATLKITYPHFRVELVAFKDEASQYPEDAKLTIPYVGGAALHVYTKFKQTFTTQSVDGSFTVPSDTAVLVLKGNVTTGTGTALKALDYSKPQKTATSLKGKALVLLIR